MKKEYSFHLLRIRELEITQKSPENNLLSPAGTEHQIQGNHSINYQWNIDKDFFSVLFNIVFIVDINGEDFKFFTSAHAIDFHIEDLKNHLEVRSSNDFDMDETLEVTLVGITISTMRGIIFEKTKGMPFSNLLIPLFDPKEHTVTSKIKGLNKEKNSKKG